MTFSICQCLEREARLVLSSPELREVEIEVAPCGAACAGLELVAPPGMAEGLRASGAFLLAPGWLDLCFRRVDALRGALLAEAARRLVLLDTGVDPAAGEKFAALAGQVGFPAEVVPVGLGPLRASLSRLLAEQNLEQAQAALGAARRQSANYAAAFDLIRSLTDLTEERAAVRRALEVFRMLFAPRTMAFVSLERGTPAFALSEPERAVDPAALLDKLAARGDQAVGESGFALAVRHAGELLGALEIQGVAAPEHLPVDFPLAVSVAGICGLAISNSRKFEEVKRADAALAAQSELLEVTLHGIGDAVISTDTEGRVRVLNPVAEELTGRPQREALGKPLHEVFRVFDPSGSPKDPVREVLEQGAIKREGSAMLLGRDGQCFAIAHSTAPVRARDGRALGAVLVFRDVSAEREAQRERDVTIDFLRLINANPRMPELLRDAAGFFQQQSGCEALGIRLEDGDDFPFRETRGFSRQFVLQQRKLLVRDAAGNAVRDPGGDPTAECLCGKVILGQEEPGLLPPDAAFWTNRAPQWHTEQLRRERPVRTCPGCSGEDFRSMALLPLHVGDQRLGLLQLNDRREGRFSPQRIALWERLAGYLAVALARSRAEELLFVANDQLVEADQRKNAFLAMLSHELRTPLSAIHSSLRLLARAPSDSDQAQRARAVIDRQQRHMAHLVSDMLDITRIARGKIQLRRERLDLAELVRRTTEDHRSLFAANGVELRVEFPQEPLWLSADPTRLVQAVGNLLGNAAKFTPRGGTVEVRAGRTSDPALAEIQVRDTGVGIPPDMLARIFEPFAQAEQAVSKGGLGLGLTLVKGMVELHGGTVAVESAGLGKGATFALTLPLEAAASCSIQMATDSALDRVGGLSDQTRLEH